VRNLEDGAFLLLLISVSVAFAWILWPYGGAILWATVLAIVFAPLYRRVCRMMGQKQSLAALSTVVIILIIVILPLSIVATLLFQEASTAYEKFQSGELNIAGSFRRGFNTLPAWLTNLLDYFGLASFASIQERLLGGLARSGNAIASKAIGIGQNTFGFVTSLLIMLYLVFFLLRDGDQLIARIRSAIPLAADQRRALFSKFTIVVRATVKGYIIVAAVQGALGGLIFWALDIHAPVLWAVVMALLSLLPVVGGALVWAPVAVYLLLAGAIWQGIVLTVSGVLVISTADNLLRPLLVGKDTKMPDYVVLISTLGGISIFGVNGLVIGPVTAAMFIAAWDLFSRAWLADPNVMMK
jgi:predicted PurR-regulated permease PerM